MNSFFSGDDLDAFWPSPMIPLPPDLQCTAAHPPVDPHSVNRSSSVWSFERFMHEAGSPPSASSVASSATVGPSATSRAPSSSPWTQEGGIDDRAALEVKNPTTTPPQLPSRHPPPVAAPLNCDDYSAILKNQLHQACAAFAQSRKTTVKPLGSTSIMDEKESLASNPSELGSDPLGTVPVGPGDSKLRTDSQSLSIPTLPASQKKSGAQCGLTTSESSREQSDDDDLGDTEITGHMGHGDDKRARRMQSNRDSARRSRRRKQEHLNELEKQVAQLRIENSSLSEHLTDVSQKFKDAAVDNRVLKADIETLRAKVKMAEDTVKRATGFNTIIQPVHSIPSIGAPLNSDHFSHQGVPNITGASQNQKLGSVLTSNTPGSAPHVSTGQNVARNKMVQTYPVQLASGADQIQKGV